MFVVVAILLKNVCCSSNLTEECLSVSHLTEVCFILICRLVLLDSIRPTLMNDTQNEIQRHILQTLRGTYMIYTYRYCTNTVCNGFIKPHNTQANKLKCERCIVCLIFCLLLSGRANTTTLLQEQQLLCISGTCVPRFWTPKADHRPLSDTTRKKTRGSYSFQGNKTNPRKKKKVNNPETNVFFLFFHRWSIPSVVASWVPCSGSQILWTMTQSSALSLTTTIELLSSWRV